jgi:flagellar hook assembly protein FlgD
VLFDLHRRSNVRLTIYNMLGQQVISLVSETLPAGRHEAEWNGRSADGAGLASGMYVMRLDVEAESGEKGSQSRTMLLLR